MGLILTVAGLVVVVASPGYNGQWLLGALLAIGGYILLVVNWRKNNG